MTELTVPRAGLAPGPVAPAQIRPQPQAMPGLAQLGQAVARGGIAIQNDALDRQMARLQVDTEKALGELRLKTEELGDPEAIDAAWTSGIAKLRDSYRTGTDEFGRPRVARQNAERFDLAFDSVANRHALALGERNLLLRQSQRAATYFDYRNTILQQADQTDPADRGDMLATHDAQIDAMVASGALTPEQAAEAKHSVRVDMEATDAVKMLSGDHPEDFLASLKAGDFATTAPEQLAKWEAAARGAVAARDKAMAAEADRLRKDRLAQSKTDLTEATALVRAGRVSSNEALAEDPDLQAEFPELVAELKGAAALRDAGHAIATMPPAELKALRAEIAAEDVTRSWQNDALKAIDAQIAANAKGYATDPVGYARAQGLPGLLVKQMPDPAQADPGAYGVAFQRAIVDAMTLQGDGYAENPPVLSNDDAAALKAATAADQDPGRRAQLGFVLASAAGAHPEILTRLGLDPVFVHVAGLQTAGRASQRLASEILRGQQAIDSRTAILPPLADRTEAVFASLDGLFGDIPGGEAQQATITAAADALYAARKRSTDPAGDIDEDAYRQALHEVMGGTGSFDSRDAAGGAQQVGGTVTLLPPGVRAAAVDDRLYSLRLQLQSAELARVRGGDRSEAALASLQSASLSGGTPTIRGEPITAASLGRAVLVAIGDDRYRMGYATNSGTLFFADSTSGGPWEFSLTRLLEADQ